jgi:hypothetical protein
MKSCKLVFSNLGNPVLAVGGLGETVVFINININILKNLLFFCFLRNTRSRLPLLRDEVLCALIYRACNAALALCPTSYATYLVLANVGLGLRTFVLVLDGWGLVGCLLFANALVISECGLGQPQKAFGGGLGSNSTFGSGRCWRSSDVGLFAFVANEMVC